MKTIMTALVATALSLNASASHQHTAVCPVNCPEAIISVKPVSKSYDQKIAEIKQAAEDKVSMLYYRQSMQTTLGTIEKQKLQLAIENLEAENAYNRLMTNLLQTVEQQKMVDQIEDISATNRYEQLMAQTLNNLATR
jgi:hypothetical protein